MGGQVEGQACKRKSEDPNPNKKRAGGVRQKIPKVVATTLYFMLPQTFIRCQNNDCIDQNEFLILVPCTIFAISLICKE